jgi:16S rRNA (cytosine967-C5)-methyltransferase
LSKRLPKAATAAAHRRPDARTLAMQVVERVLYDQAYAAAALSAEFSRYPQLSVRERAFATELAYTALRCRRALEEKLSNQAPRGLPKDRVVRAALLVAAVQALLLDKATLAIAVDAAVTRVKAHRGAKPAGFVNALLRRVAQQPALNRAEALRANLPNWLRERLVAAVGVEETDALIGAHESLRTSPNSIDIRLMKDRAVPEWLMDASPGRWLPESRRVSGIGDPRGYPGYESGDFVIQEEGAQLIAWALDVPQGARVLDVCAGRGQKTSLLAERIGPEGSVWSTDLHESKLAALREEMKRLHLSNVQTQALDWSVGGGNLPTDFEFVLVDAPCSGTGTLYKRPEILDRLQPDDPGRMGELATQILRSVARYCRSGAQVLYAVCSVLPEEAEAVLSRVQDIFEQRPFKTQVLRSAFGDQVCAGRLLPLRHGTDGYFLAQLQKR